MTSQTAQEKPKPDRRDRLDSQLLFFDAKDRQHEIDLFGKGSLTQPEINAMAAGFQPRP